MKILKFLLSALLTGGIIILTLSCTGNTSATATPKPQISTVQKGNISITVTGTGNLALKTKQWLSFGQTGLVSQASTVKILEVLVSEGQVVEQGQVLAKADTSDWQDKITSLEYQLDAAKAGLDQAKYNLLQGQNNLANDEAKLSQQADIQAIQDKIDGVKAQIETAKLMISQATQSTDSNAQMGVEYWQKVINDLSISPIYRDNAGNRMKDGGLLGMYEKQLADLLADPEHYLASSVTGSAASVNAIKNIQRTIEQDKASLVNLTNNITNAQNKVDEAQRALDNEKKNSQEIVAPIKGLLTQVKVARGDIVQRNANLIEIADPEKFIANIMVTERDVMSIKIDGEATVAFDAINSLNFPAKIIQIAPLATVQQGVVNYKVTVELTSLRPVFPNRPVQAPQSTSGAAPAAGSSPTATSTPGFTFKGPVGSSNSLGTSQPIISLKDGLSATVTIPIQQKDNILIIPSRAVTRQGQTASVQIVKGTSTETRNVKTGLSDATNVEITEGLVEGEQVMVKAASTSTTTNTRPGGPPGGGFIIR